MMIELGPATEDEMVLAFLRAEVESSRFGRPYQNCFDALKKFGINQEHLLGEADLHSVQHNSIRKDILRIARGYGDSQLLFRSFPDDATWRCIALERTDLGKLKYGNWPPWPDFSGGTRRVVDGAANIDSFDLGNRTNNVILAVAADVRAGKRYAELIGAEGEGGDIILIEGHVRATAYVLAQLPEGVECIVGSSPAMHTWAAY
jgi:hypothetical protein